MYHLYSPSVRYFGFNATNSQVDGECFIVSISIEAIQFAKPLGRKEDKMRNKMIIIGILMIVIIFGCSTTQKSLTSDESTLNESVAAGQPDPVISANRPPKEGKKMVFSYMVRENLDVQVTFENETAYDAVQLGLSLLNKCQVEAYVPGVEEQTFFPEFFAMVNVDTSDGLLYISEKEAVNFASAMFIEYQNKVLPPERIKNMREPHVVDKYIVPQS